MWKNKFHRDFLSRHWRALFWSLIVWRFIMEDRIFKLECKTDRPFSQLDVPPAVKDAIITSEGKLTPKFEYIAELRRQRRYANLISWKALKAKVNYYISLHSLDCTVFSGASGHKTGTSSKMKGERRILVLGAGYVSGPVIDYFCRLPNTSVTVGK